MANKFVPQYSRVKGISERRRLPRLDKIRMGIKKKSEKTGKEYPAETEYFVCPKEVQKVFGEKPTELEIMFPIDNLDVIFPQAYTMYGKTAGVKCKGDGETAMRKNEESGLWEEVTCPCPYLDKKKCSLRGHLQFMIPKVNMGGVYQLDTGSYNSTVDVNSGLDYIAELVGRFNMIPLVLKRIPRETHAEGSKQTHYTLMVELRATLEEINMIKENPDRIFQRKDDALTPVMGLTAKAQYSLPQPEEINPALDPGGVTEIVRDDPGEPGPDPASMVSIDPGPKNPEEEPPEEEPPLPTPPGEEEPTSTVDVSVNETLTWITKKAFGELPQEEMIKLLKKFFRGLSVEKPTPAPLEEHTVNELKTLYRWLYQEHCPMAKHR
jgi:hypothetical protein